MARPACPAPMTTVAMVLISPSPHGATPARGAGSIHHDGDIRRIGHDVIDRRPLLRLRNQRFDIFAFRVGIDLVSHLDAAEAVADIAVDAEDALQIHVPLDGRPDRAQLNVTVLGYRGDTGGQA